MATSQARIEANRRNAQLSTGPTTAEGKARSRLNAFQHGLAGAGDLLAPDEDAALVAERTRTFAAAFGGSGGAEEYLAHRAAVLSVRMDRADADGKAGMALHVHAALAAFDADRMGELDRLEDQLTRPGAMHAAKAELETDPAGVDRLIEFWDREARALPSMTNPSSRRDQLGSLLDLTAEETRDSTPEQLAERIDAERVRLRAVDAATRAERLALLDRSRMATGRVARLDPPPEVVQIRRYDAAAERGFFRTVRAIRDLRRDQAPAAKHAEPRQPAAIPSIAPAPVAAPPPAERAPSIAAPLGSFRPDIAVAASPLYAGVGAFDYRRIRAELFPHERRSTRKIKKKRR